jgi:hypothetical protein
LLSINGLKTADAAGLELIQAALMTRSACKQAGFSQKAPANKGICNVLDLERGPL